MKKTWPFLALGLLAFLAGCPKKPATPEAPRDYEGARQRSQESHRSMDKTGY